MISGVLFSVLAALSINAGNLIEKQAVDRMVGFSARHSGHMFRQLVTSKQWVFGFVICLFALGFQTIAFSLAPIAVVQSIFGASLVLLVIASRIYLHESLGRNEIVALVAIVVSAVLISASLSGSNNAVGTTGSFSSAIIASLATLAVVITIFVINHFKNMNDGFLYGISSGLLYGIAALGTKGASTLLDRHGLIGSIPWIFSSPYPYIFVVTSGLGLMTFQTGLQRGRISLVGPLSNVVSSVFVVAVGMVVFGEHLPAHLVPKTLRLAGFVGVLIGSWLLAGNAEVRATTPTSSPSTDTQSSSALPGHSEFGQSSGSASAESIDI